MSCSLEWGRICKGTVADGRSWGRDAIAITQYGGAPERVGDTITVLVLVENEPCGIEIWTGYLDCTL